MTASDRSDLNNRKLTHSLAGFWLSKTGQHAGSDLRHLQRYVGMGFTEAQLMTAILKAAEQDAPSLASLHSAFFAPCHAVAAVVVVCITVTVDTHRPPPSNAAQHSTGAISM